MQPFPGLAGLRKRGDGFNATGSGLSGAYEDLLEAQRLTFSVQIPLIQPYNRYGIGRISIDNLFIAQREKDQARQQYVQALRGYWEAYYRLRQVTLYDFLRGGRIGE